jgi:hypothetical protein
MGLAGKMDAVLLFSLSVYVDIICVDVRWFYMCQTSLMLRKWLYPILLVKLPLQTQF